MTMTDTKQNLIEIARRETEEIDNAESAEKTELVGDTVVNINYNVSQNGKLNGIHVGYNVQGARVTVDLYGRRMTVAAGGVSHHVGIGDSTAITEACRYWERSCPREIDV